MWLYFVFVSLFRCTNTLSSAVGLGGVLAADRMAGVPMGMSLELDFEDICWESGFACENCTHAVMCVPLPDGYLKVPLQECPQDQTCNAHLGKCTSEHAPECQMDTQLFEHTCEQVGIFPDAHDCRKYHVCSPSDGTPFGRPPSHHASSCLRHYGYNPLTAQCSIRLKKGQCTSKVVPECTRVGQSGPLQLSPNHYYICLSRNEKLHPQVFLCPHGWFFVDGFCRPNKDDANSNFSEEKVVANNIVDASITEEATTKRATSGIESFFPTENTSSYAPDNL